jgi:xanthine dehydrogenase small subunit
MAQQSIEFHFRNEIVRVAGLPPTTTVLQWLRDHARRPGTKEGCAEGDCGACTVIVAELADAAAPARQSVNQAVTIGDLRLRPINACMRFLPTLHGKALFTVEDLQACAGGRLHPVQQALVDCHGSQCGFCTPGFVMSLFATYTRPDRHRIADDLAGNLCRCTGYRPILDAGERMFDLPPVRLDPAPIAERLRELRTAAADPFVYAAPNPAYGTPADPRTDTFHAPRSAAGFAALRAALPEARLLAGATDIGIWVNKQFRDLGDLLYIGDVPELAVIDRTHDGKRLSIGAAAPLEDAWAALAELVPEVAETELRFAGPPTRHAGTMGGNLANGSPIGDSAPVLMALDTSLTLQCGEAQRMVKLDEFYLHYMKNALRPGEFVRSIEVKPPEPGTRIRAYKISKRRDSDISALSCGLAVVLDGERVRQARLAFGGMAAVVQRAGHAEAALRGALWNEASLRAAMAALAQDFQPLTDLRASKDYRLRVARNLLLRFWMETRPEAPLPSTQTNIWAALRRQPVEAHDEQGI